MRNVNLLLVLEDDEFGYIEPVIYTKGWHAPIFQFYATSQTFQLNNLTQTFEVGL